MRLRRLLAAACVTALPALLSGCGYYSTSSRTAKDIKSIAVPFFENTTSEPNLEIIVTERVVDNLVSDNTLSVRDEGVADAVLEGKIVSFQNVPFSFNRDLNAEEYRVVITVEATLYSRSLGRPIWEKQVIKGDGAYFVDTNEPGFQYADALAEAIKEITDRILNLTVQDW
jgi:outer membrane lipopolysaccharide assembly protein LptE/RlpB